MMTVVIVKRMKVKKIDLDKADVVKWEVCSRDEVKHVGKKTVCDFQRGTGWRARKSNNRGSTSTARMLERDKVMQVRGLRGSENLVCKKE